MTHFAIHHKARCVVAVDGDTSRDTFLVGTAVAAGVRERPPYPAAPSNDVQLVQFKPDEGEVECLRIYEHTAGEVWGLAACPQDRRLFASVHTAPPAHKIPAAAGGPEPVAGTVFRMTDMDADVVSTLTSPLERVADLSSAHASSLRLARWGGAQAALATAGDTDVVLWSAADGAGAMLPMHSAELGTGSSRSAGGPASALAWRADSADVVLVAAGGAVAGMDMRAPLEAFRISR